MPRSDRSRPMSVKYWSYAGLMLTDWCNARCASCYLNCGPARSRHMTVDEALAYWRSLVAACPRGCRIHLSGGEPFGDWEMLIELAQRAKDEGLGPLEKIETNAFWAVDADVVRRCLVELDRAGMVKLTISADPYHQRFVPIERPRLAAVVALEVLGESRVQIRWRDWLEGGFDAGALGEQAWRELLLRYAAAGRDRLCGRAAAEIAPRLPLKNLDAFVDKSCRQTILRSRHVHIDPDGYVMPATCVGLTLGCAKHNAIAEIWRFAGLEHSRRPVLSALIEHGPVELVEPAISETGFVPLNGYADKRHLCWHVRSHLAGKGLFQSELGPIEAYN